MLNKQAQEELYNTYYNQGVELALGQVKVAGKTKEVIKKMIQLPAAGLGVLGSAKALDSLPPNIKKEITEELLASVFGLSGVAGYNASGKAVDLADAGIQKLRKNIKR